MNMMDKRESNLKKVMKYSYKQRIREILSKLKTQQEKNAFFLGLMFSCDFEMFQKDLIEEIKREFSNEK